MADIKPENNRQTQVEPPQYPNPSPVKLESGNQECRQRCHQRGCGRQKRGGDSHHGKDDVLLPVAQNLRLRVEFIKSILLDLDELDSESKVLSDGQKNVV